MGSAPNCNAYLFISASRSASPTHPVTFAKQVWTSTGHRGCVDDHAACPTVVDGASAAQIASLERNLAARFPEGRERVEVQHLGRADGFNPIDGASAINGTRMDTDPAPIIVAAETDPLHGDRAMMDRAFKP